MILPEFHGQLIGHKRARGHNAMNTLAQIGLAVQSAKHVAGRQMLHAGNLPQKLALSALAHTGRAKEQHSFVAFGHERQYKEREADKVTIGETWKTVARAIGWRHARF